MPDHAVGTREQWLFARKELLTAEKEHTHRGDELARGRQELPWVPINGHGVTLLSESIAPLDVLQADAARMDWTFPWVSSLGSDYEQAARR
jgi:predicted dithiol-disulfide oxidoreductase (DUF899 family)